MRAPVPTRLVLASFVLAAQLTAATTKAAPEFLFRSYQQAEGLHNLAVNALARDSQGFLWVGTQNGLYRFLGSTFQQFGVAEGIPDPTIEDVLAAPDGTLWVGTLKNLYRWTGERFVPAAKKPIQIWRSGRIISECPGRLLIVDGDRLTRLTYHPEDGTVVSYSAALPETPPKHLGSLTLGPDGKVLWFGCDGQICSLFAGNITTFGKSEHVPNEYCYSLRFDAKGSLWAILEHHVLELSPGASRFTDRTPSGGDPNSVYHRQPLVVDPQGRILTSTGRRLERWDGSGWLTIGPPNGMTFGHLNALSFDSSGDLWLGSAGQGLQTWTGYDNWQGWTDNQGLPSPEIWTPAIAGAGKFYTGTELGPAAIDAETGRVTPMFSSGDWTYGQVGGLAIDPEGFLWAGTKSGSILRIDLRTRNVALAGKVPAVVLSMAAASSGQIFVLTKKGLFAFVPSRSPIAIESIEEAGSQRMSNSCVAPDGSLWFATRGISQFHEGAWNRPLIAGLGSDTKVWLGIACGPDNTLWLMGKAGEVWRLSSDDGILQAAPLPLPDYYRSLVLLAILSDSRGWLWLGTDAGLLVWNGSSWRHLTQESGLIWNDVNTNGLASVGGSIWVGTSGGLGRISHPERAFDGASLPLSLINARQGASHDMSFDFAVPSTVNRSDLTFKYRIAELDPGWIESRDTNANFAALPPGSYTFDVFAHNRALNISSPVASRRFKILSPWWRTTWFLALCGVLAAGLLVFLYHLRMRHLVSQRQTLEMLVQNRTIELEASRAELLSQATHDGLTGLKNRSAIMKTLDEEIARAQRDQTALTVVLADIDHFKHINDTYGHLAGDAAIRRFANAVFFSIRTYDSAGRYGGEEFLILLPGVSSDSAQERVAHLHCCISNLLIEHHDRQFEVSCSLGAVSIDPGQVNVEHDDTLAAADRALYEAKGAGRNRVAHQSLTTNFATVSR